GVAGQPQTRLENITDGSANTMMVSEIIRGQGGDLRGYSWWGGAGAYTAWNLPNANAPDVLMGGNCNIPATYNLPCTVTSTDQLPRMQIARSKHLPGGVNVVYCDGHVGWINNSVDINVWRALSTTMGNETVVIP